MQTLSNAKETEFVYGIMKSILNSNELRDEAKLLYDNKKYARCYSLLLYSIEELGKVIILVNRMKDGNKSNNHIHNQKFKDHIPKIKEVFLLVKNFTEEFAKVYTEGSSRLLQQANDVYNNSEEYDERKKIAFYVCVENGKFTLPSESITQEEVHELFKQQLFVATSVKRLLTEEKVMIPSIE